MTRPKLGVGTATCYCTKCGELFNSPAAFDHHLKYATTWVEEGKRRRKVISAGAATHDVSGMPRNARGALVTALMPESVTFARGGGTASSETTRARGKGKEATRDGR